MIGAKTHEHHIAVIPAREAIEVTNLLASIGIALEGLKLSVLEDDGVMFEITPEAIHQAWKSMDTAVHQNWLSAP